MIGASTLVFSALIKLTPERWVARINTDNLVNEDAEAQSAILDKFNKIQGQKATKNTAINSEEEPDYDDDYNKKNDDF